MPLFNAPSIPTAAANASTTATATSVSSSTTNVQLLALNVNRKGASFMNDSTANLLIEFGSTASRTAYTVKVPAGGYFEIPFFYTGVIAGLWDAASGRVLIREFT